MPVYVYRNLNTNEKFEIEQRITEPALTTHPETGDPVKRLIQPVGIAFKGSGFYVNDSKGGSSKSASSTKSDASTESQSADTSGTDSTASSKETSKSNSTPVSSDS
ncbi:MAG: FmdB family transcriptional regulator, partial [Deinococcota bacterium]